MRSKDLRSQSVPARTLQKGAVQRKHADDRLVAGRVLAPGGVKTRNYAPRGTAERHLDPAMIPRDILEIDMGDGAVLTGYSKTQRPMRTGTMRILLGSLESVGDSDTVAEITRNGASLGTITIPAGELSAFIHDTGYEFDAFDRWQMRVTAAGTDAIGLSFFARIA